MKEVPRSCYGKGKEHSCGTWTSCNLSRILLVQDYCVQFYCGGPFYYYYTRFKHIKLFTKVKNLKCERSQCHRRNARLYRAVLSLDLKVATLTVISEVTVSKSVQWCKQDLNLPRTWTIHLCRQRQRHYASERHHCQPPQHAAACLYILTSVFAAAAACGTAASQRTVHTDNTV